MATSYAPRAVLRLPKGRKLLGRLQEPHFPHVRRKGDPERAKVMAYDPVAVLLESYPRIASGQCGQTGWQRALRI